ncbi:aldehyde reductase [Pararhodobacter sp. SW119]|uniref:SDR family oxidoreductase n=1 Tax=Pararhodobacter sp. SW119 TaxID=2780075 RepID=UPI001AE0D887|nr:aldehyde reductase [Pararhodobacter sp. SW119]
MTGLVLLTGASGFIAKHIAQRLLAAGWRVRATVRNPKRIEEVRAALAPHLAPDVLDQGLDFVELDMTSDANWDRALAGVDALLHTASPFPITEPEHEDELIRPAVDGTLRALRAARAAGVGRVILTSSIAAIMHRDLPDGRATYDDSDWTDPDHPRASAYDRSKMLAERAAWDFARDEAPGIALTTVNPGLVFGPLMDDRYGSSVSLVRRLLSGKDPMQPNFAIPVVDVRDVAEMHLRALQRPETAGHRFIASAGTMSFPEMAQVLKAAHPDRRIATRTAPNLVMRLLALWDREARTILPALGWVPQLSAARAAREMDMQFIPAADALRATAEDLIRRKLV